MSHTADFVDELYRSRRATIGIVGMGYVGMPLALAAWTAGFRILGYDSDSAKVEAINEGRSYIIISRAPRSPPLCATNGCAPHQNSPR